MIRDRRRTTTRFRLSSARCDDCGYERRSWGHLHRCVTFSVVEYVKCPVSSCMAYTRHPSGVCSPETHDEAHMLYVMAKARKSA